MTMLPERASAKINLYLHVVGRRPDGYHLLDSLVVFADVGDTLEAVPAPELSLSVEGPFAGALGDMPYNLALRATRMLADMGETIFHIGTIEAASGAPAVLIEPEAAWFQS